MSITMYYFTREYVMDFVADGALTTAAAAATAVPSLCMLAHETQRYIFKF